MNSRKHIQEELEGLGSHLPPDTGAPYSVPEGYFDNFADRMLAKVKGESNPVTDELAEIAPLLAGIPKHPTLSLPHNYFVSLESDLCAIISEETVSPLLAGIDRTMPNAVPAGYFEGLSTEILSKVERPAAKVVSMNRSSWMRMAVAAVIAGIIAVGGIAYFNGNSGANANVQSTAWVEKGLKGVSDATLTDFINATDPAAQASDVAKTTTHSTEVRQLMTDVSEGEMDAFLAQVPTDDDELLIIN
jgi:hypothetical protein